MLLGMLLTTTTLAAEPRVYAHPSEVDAEVASPVDAAGWPHRCWVDVHVHDGQRGTIDMAESCEPIKSALRTAVVSGRVGVVDGLDEVWVHLTGPRGQATTLTPGMAFAPENLWSVTKRVDLPPDAANRRCVVRILPAGLASENVVGVRALDTEACPGRMGEAVRAMAAELQIRRAAVSSKAWEQRLVVWERADLRLGRKRLDSVVIEGDARPTKRVAPVYPLAMKREDVGAVVCSVRVSVDAHGLPTDVRPAENVAASCTEHFVTASRQSLLRWRFMPAVKQGVPTDTDFDLTLTFELGDRG